MPDTLRKLVEFVAIFAVALAVGWMVRRLFSGPTVSPAELKSRLDAGSDVVLLDVRTPEEYRDGHLAGSVNLPLHQVAGTLAANAGEFGRYAESPVVVVCRSGSRAHAAARMLRKAGLRDVRVLAGGMIGWTVRRFPVARGGRQG